VCRKETKSYKNKNNQLNLFRNGLKEISIRYPTINWIGLIFQIPHCMFQAQFPVHLSPMIV